MSNTFDLWHLLEKYDVVVPVIQRDYAQGRKDREYIRKTFLGAIKDCIDNRISLSNEISLSLDFVYGNIEGNRFFPLDGQQRLTTLWLIYWYISLKAGKLSEDKKILSKFYYETRTSSKEFCKALCDKMPDEVPNRIVDYIKSQTWFYSIWLQDSTISAMLRTIGGDNAAADDNIESIFKDVNFVAYRDMLKNSSVNFELMVIGTEKLPISDDLYIKMNARGKTLTDFENFKADLVAWIQSDQNPDKELFNQETESSEIQYKQYYPARFDNEWMNVFWSSAFKQAGSSFNGRIDDIYFSFLNRYVLNMICLNNTMTPAEYAPGKELETNIALKARFDKLYGTGMRKSSADDSLVNYEGFDIYKEYITFDTLKKLDDILKVTAFCHDIIDKALEIPDADTSENNLTEYSFIPRHVYSSGEQKLASTRQKERIYFLGISLFIENCKMISSDGHGFDEGKFKKWMRVIKNLIENAAIDNVPAMVTCMRLIKKIAGQLVNHNNDIYETLKCYSDSIPNSQLGNQLKEEKIKAEKILEDNDWEKRIVEVEKYAFFNGTIRFLYFNGTTVVWDDFNEKFENARNLFKDKDNTVPKETITLFLKQFSGFEKIRNKYLFTTLGYHLHHKCWKKDILCSEDSDIAQAVHSLLKKRQDAIIDDEDYRSFVNSSLIDKIISKDENYKYRYHWHYYWAVHKDYSQNEGVYVSKSHTDKCVVLKTLSDERKITIHDPSFNSYHIAEHPFCRGYYWGIKLTFEYNGVLYNWRVYYGNDGEKDKIYKYENNKDSRNGMIWENGSNLLSDIDEYDDWN